MALLLDVRTIVECSRQCADVSDIHGNSHWHRGRPGGKSSISFEFRSRHAFAGGYLVRFGVHGGAHIHWQRTELYGEEHRGEVRSEDAVVRRLHDLFRARPYTPVRGR